MIRRTGRIQVRGGRGQCADNSLRISRSEALLRSRPCADHLTIEHVDTLDTGARRSPRFPKRKHSAALPLDATEDQRRAEIAMIGAVVDSKDTMIEMQCAEPSPMNPW